MADLPQAAPSVELYAGRSDLTRAAAHTPGFDDLRCSALLPKHDEHEQPHSLFGCGDVLVVETEADRITDENPTQSPCGAGCHGKVTSTEKLECGTVLLMKQDGSGMLTQKFSEMEGHGKVHETANDDGDRVASAHVLIDTDAYSCQLSKISVFPREENTCEGVQGPAKKGTQTNASQTTSEENKDGQRPEQSKIKQAGWNTLEEPEFAMEDSSWPTLAEAHDAKSVRSRSSQARTLQTHSSPSDKEVVSTQRAPTSQASLEELPVETSKHTNANTSVPGSKYKSPHKKGGYGKASFTTTENLPLTPMGIHVPSANMFVPDHSVKGNGLVGINKYFPGPHQAPAHGLFYYPRAESLASFPHNSAVPPTYGRGHPGWQHYGRGYGDANYKRTSFTLPYDQQHLGLRHSGPPVTPFMNTNLAHYNYPSYQGVPSPGFNSVASYWRPPVPRGVMVQAPVDVPTLQEMLQKQIEYYFSSENLVYDTFLISKMDDEGFVPLSLIASFPRVRNLTWNTMYILEAMKNSTLVEVKNGKLRSHEWRRWKPGMQGGPLGIVNRAGSGNVRDREKGELEESQQGHFQNMRSLSESRMVAGSCAAPWTGMMAVKVGTVSVPTVTSIDSR
ncbi:hypothetical protein GOP47_0000837 [Adiantum capillus-veneris]|uniref:HTH La-type RNA-binding domain-containing protein n=1 Tax=Adiantum capillus-veneris TaxID=13818 RepID=A0A9D4ZR33_ADICA|nr:hypothetical protein GOP47_0000837 [Adiantum capillus-veneris]